MVHIAYCSHCTHTCSWHRVHMPKTQQIMQLRLCLITVVNKLSCMGSPSVTLLYARLEDMNISCRN